MTPNVRFQGLVQSLEDVAVFDALKKAVVLELPDGVNWMHQPHSRHLFLRPESVHMLKEVLQLYEGKKLGVVVTCAFSLSRLPSLSLLSCRRGTPGIGKSWFGELLLWVLVSAGVRVVYQQARAAMWYFFHSSSEHIYEGDVRTKRWWPQEFSSDLGAFFIFDPAASGTLVEPLLVDQFTVVTASPNRKHFKEFLKGAGQLRFLPSWSLADLERILPFCDLTGNAAARKRVLTERFEIVGGIPRKIFDNSSLEEWKSIIASELLEHAGDIQSLLANYRDLMKDYTKAHNNLVFLHSTPPHFDKARLFLASKYVRQCYGQQLKQFERRQRADEIKSAWNDPARAEEAGKKFEPFAFESLFFGGRFALFPFREDGTHAPTGSDRQLGPFQGSELFTNVADVKLLLRDVLYRPSQTNFPILDFFALCDNDLMLFQMTVSDHKPIPEGIFSDAQVRSLLELYSSMNLSGRVVVVFVAPDFVLHAFKLTETGWKKDSSKSESKKSVPSLFQFVDPHMKLKCTCIASVLYLPVLPLP